MADPDRGERQPVYFRRTGQLTFAPTEHVVGAWNLADQHIAPALGLLLHEVERDMAARHPGGGWIATRLSFDILGPVPVEEFEITAKLLRPGKTVEMVQASMIHNGRPIVLLRAWLMATRDTAALEGSPVAPLPEPEAMPEWDPTTLWPGGFLASARVRRIEKERGRSQYWVRTPVMLLDGEPVSATARAAGLFDIANGMAVRADPRRILFPNVDLTAHLFREPRAGWLGFDTSVSFGPGGVGLTHSVLYDETGPLGTVAQSLTIRPA